MSRRNRGGNQTMCEGGGGRETTANDGRVAPAPVPVPGWMPGVVQYAPFESVLEVPRGGREGHEVRRV